MFKDIPPAALAAAKRAFWRTTAQGYATSISATLVLSVVSLIQEGPANAIAVVVAVVTAFVTPLAAGIASFFQWLAKGIPVEYEEAAIEQGQGGL